MTNDKPFTKAGDFPPEVLKLFDQYVHNVIDRRGFLDGAAKFAVGGLTAAGFLEALSPRFAEAQQVSPERSAPEGGEDRVPIPARLREGERIPRSPGARRQERRRRCRRSSSSTRTGG